MSMNPPIVDWPGQTAWIIGASSGIGLATAQRLHRLGARVIVSARSQQALDDFVSQHPGSQALVMDVSDRAAVAAAAQEVLSGGVPQLVCYCAGHYSPMRAYEMELNELLQHQQVNVIGALHVLTAIVPAMEQAASLGHSAHISLVASVAGWRGLPQSLAYGPTKAALINLAETLYLDLRPRGMGISVVNPGFVQTPLTRQNTFKMPALITADQAAAELIHGWERGLFDIHFPRRFTWTLKLLRLLPYRWYFALVHRLTGL